jgi:hypothetical protein
MEFFELLFNNSFVLIIIVGILANIFKRFMEASKEIEIPKNQSGQQTQVDTIPTLTSDRNVLTQKQDYRAINQWMANPSEGAEQTHSAIKNMKQNKQSVRMKDTSMVQKTKIDERLISRQKLVEGIIWSEILGTPKALKHKQRRI